MVVIFITVHTLLIVWRPCGTMQHACQMEICILISWMRVKMKCLIQWTWGLLLIPNLICFLSFSILFMAICTEIIHFVYVFPREIIELYNNTALESDNGNVSSQRKCFGLGKWHIFFTWLFISNALLKNIPRTAQSTMVLTLLNA